MKSRSERIIQLKQALSEKVLVVDGPTGTMIHGMTLTAADYGGADLEGCCEHLILTKPQTLADVVASYLEVGADISKTGTFSGTPLVLGEFGVADKAYEINRKIAELTLNLAQKFSTPVKPRWVAGSMGPTTKALSVTGGIEFLELVKNFEVQAEGLYDGGVDYFLIETCQDTRNIKAALMGIDRVNQKKGLALPIAVSGTIEPMGTMLAGQTAEALAISLHHRDLLYLGLNCATGPEFMTDSIRSLAQLSKCPVGCAPNAGLPDEDGKYLESPEMMSRVLRGFGEKSWINLIGGCCGTTPAHIKAFVELAREINPRKAPHLKGRSFVSGIDWVEVTEEVRPLLVGERTNVIGSRLFKNLVTEEKWEEASEIAKRQIKNQAQIIDICLANPDRDEFADMKKFLESVVRKVSVPLMIDSTDSKVIAMALTYSQGKAFINSINLEDGEERFEEICPLAREFGAAIVVGCIDDDPQQGMGVSLERKLEIAERSFQLLTNKYGIPAEDIYWDALVFPCGTGDQQYAGSAVATIDALGALKKKFPGTKTVLGVSNVSFGLPSAGREVLNSVFLYHCTKSGLDLAIVNSEKLERFAEIPPEEIQLCDDLLWNRGPNPIAGFNAHFGVKVTRKKISKENFTLEERLARYIIEGSRDGLIEDLELARQVYKPLDIINGPLMAGMDEVGRLFNDNKLIVAEVLQSAEAMKLAVKTLEAHMEKTSASLRGRVVLATVKGDVHDIGKNLVEIILSNNGFEVVNLGIKIPSQELIEAQKKYNPSLIGLSGLLVKSAQQMVETAADMAAAGITTPILVGGAALTRNFVDRKIAPAYTTGVVEYANDAMDGLDLAKQIVIPEKFIDLQSKIKLRRSQLAARVSTPSNAFDPGEVRSSSIAIQESPLVPTDLSRHRLELPLDRVWNFINPLMLYGKHLGVSGLHIRDFDNPDHKKSAAIRDLVHELMSDAKSWMKARSVFQFFRANSDGNSLSVFPEIGETPLVTWKFKRQQVQDGLCLADMVNPAGRPQDYVCLFVTSALGPIREKADELKERGEFLKSHALLSLALETAEASAEMLHSQLRAQWGFPDHPDMKMMDRFQARYRGKRYSFGYPACPELEYQKELFELLKPEEMGVTLTEGFMMSPESSVSALVFSHPTASYFGVGNSSG